MEENNHKMMDRARSIIRTSWIGIAANVLLAAFKAGVEMLASPVNELLGTSIPAELTSQIKQEVSDFEGVHGFYYSERDKMLSVDVVPDIFVHDDAALIAQLTAELQPLAPGMQVVVVVDHNYSE